METRENTDSPREENSRLEIGHGRRISRGNIATFLRGLWENAFNVSPRVGKVLQPTARTKEAAGVSAKAEARARANSQISWLANRPEFKYFAQLLEKIETDSYFTLRNMHVKKSDISMEYAVGYENGKLAVIDDIRSLMTTGIVGLKRDHEQIKNEKLNK